MPIALGRVQGPSPVRCRAADVARGAAPVVLRHLVPLDQLLPYSSRCVAVAFAYDRVFEAELRESLKSVASKKCTVALNGDR